MRIKRIKEKISAWFDKNDRCWKVSLGAFGIQCAVWCLLLVLVFMIATLVLGIYFSALHDSHEVYPMLTSMTRLSPPMNDTYQASVQCLGAVLQNITSHCDGNGSGDVYTTLVPCTEYPSKKSYTEIVFVCYDTEFVEFLESQVGSKHTEREHEYANPLGMALLILWAVILFCFFAGLLLVGFCVFTFLVTHGVCGELNEW